MTDNIILHGDARELAQRVPSPINLLLTDPPFGMDFKSNMSTTPQGMKYSEKIANDGDLKTALILFYEVMEPLVAKLAPEADVYVFARWDLAHMFKKVLEQKLGLKVPMQLIWNKADPGLGDLEGCWGCGYEVILYAKKGRRPIRYRRGAVIECDKVPPSKMIHPTEKPVPLLEKLIDMSTEKGDLVVDPFSGSGSTSVAAMNTGRNSVGIELAEHFVERSCKRLEVVTLL